MSGIIADNISSNSGLIKAPSAGVWVKISAVTASSSATVSFTSGIDSTYKKYCFMFNSIHPATNDSSFTFQANASGGSGYDETMTTTHWTAYHPESDSTTEFAYKTANDQAQGTAFQILGEGVGADNDQCISGYIYLFNPSSTTYIKDFMARTNNARHNDSTEDEFTAGYFNTTSAIDAIQFKMSSGNIDTGTITLYGIN